MVAMVKEFVAHFISLEAKNAQLREAAKSSTDQLEKANKLATNARREVERLKKEPGQAKAKLEEENQRIEAQTQADEKEGSLRRSTETLFGRLLRHLHYPFSL
jgi:chromosome segregation ATPase